MITTAAKVLREDIRPLLVEQNAYLQALLERFNEVEGSIHEQILEVLKDIHSNTREVLYRNG